MIAVASVDYDADSIDSVGIGCPCCLTYSCENLGDYDIVALDFPVGSTVAPD